MVYVLPKRKLGYFPIPKNANTSIKAGLKEAFADEPFVTTTNKRLSRRLVAMTDGCYRFAVLRDPLKRAISGYGNRVIFYRDLERSSLTRMALAAMRLPLRPEPNVFFENLPAYMRVNNRIWRHFLPQHRYLGEDPTLFDRLCPIGQIGSLAEELSERTGVTVRFPHLQTGGPKHAVGDLSPAARAMIDRLYAKDYELFGPYLQDAPAARDAA